MNEKELDFILQEGEGLKIEFKEFFDKSIAKEMVAFANTVGGRIFVGVDDNDKFKRKEPLKEPLKEPEKRQEKIIEFIKEHEKVKRKDLVVNLGVSLGTLKKDISKLMLKGIIKRVGPDKTGYYKIIEKKLKS